MEQGRMAEAAELLVQGSVLLAATNHRLELAKLLCTRAELERRTPDLSAARETLHEIVTIAAEIGARPDSELAQRLDQIRKALSANELC
jgi:hypothetical protein